MLKQMRILVALEMNLFYSLLHGLYILENDVGCTMRHEMLSFGSLYEVINGNVLKCLGQGKGSLE